MADFNGSHGLFISAFFADGIPQKAMDADHSLFLFAPLHPKGGKVVAGVIPNWF
jgi:hypothetical protein